MEKVQKITAGLDPPNRWIRPDTRNWRRGGRLTAFWISKMQPGFRNYHHPYHHQRRNPARCPKILIGLAARHRLASPLWNSLRSAVQTHRNKSRPELYA
jgi:hypothetical protein